LAWIFLIIAAIFETAWTYCVKFLKFDNFKSLRWANFYKINEGLPVIAPLIGYIIFGVANVYFFSLAIKQLPLATAFAVWTALTLAMLKLTEVMFLNGSTSWKEVFFLTLIMVGIIGLKTQTSI
jgi:quaternary ammonium compound-resistance protein SugE